MKEVDLEVETDVTEYLQRGTYCRISLEENPSTGYKWSFESEGGVMLVQDNYIRTQSDYPGMPGTRIFTVGVVNDGSFHVAQKRSWEQD